MFKKNILSLIVVAQLCVPHINAMQAPQQVLIKHESRLARLAKVALSDCKSGLQTIKQKLKPYYTDPIIATGLGIIALTTTGFLGYLLGLQQGEQQRLSINPVNSLEPAQPIIEPAPRPAPPIQDVQDLSIPGQYLVHNPIVIPGQHARLIVAQPRVTSQFINIKGTPTCSLHSLKNIIALVDSILHPEVRDQYLAQLNDQNFVTTMIDDMHSEWNQIIWGNQIATLVEAQEQAYELKYPKLHTQFPLLFPDPTKIIPISGLTSAHKEAVRKVCKPVMEKNDYIQMYPTLHKNYPDLFPEAIIPLFELTEEQLKAINNEHEQMNCEPYPLVSIKEFARAMGQSLGDRYLTKQEIQLVIDHCKAQGMIDPARNIHIFSSIADLDEKNYPTHDSLDIFNQTIAELQLPGTHAVVVGNMNVHNHSDGHWIGLVINRKIDPTSQQPIVEYIVADSIAGNAMYNQTLRRLITVLEGQANDLTQQYDQQYNLYWNEIIRRQRESFERLKKLHAEQKAKETTAKD